jgi:hypothetical protein
MVRKYRYNGHGFQKWLNKKMNQHNIKPEVLAVLSGCNLASIRDWRRGSSLPKIVSFWAICRTLALYEKVSPQDVAINILPVFDGDTRDPHIPIWT